MAKGSQSRFLAAFLILIGIGAVGADSIPRWTWLSGSSTSAEAGVYSTGASANPGSRYGSAVWAVKDWTVPGDFPIVYVFSGFGFGPSTTSTGFLKDMWKFNTTSNRWTWIMGPSILQGNPHVSRYEMNSTFVMKNSFSSGYLPDARIYAHSFEYNDGLYLFSGEASTSVVRAYADFWKFNRSLEQWSWISGSLGVDVAGVDGTFQQSTTTTNPGSVFEFTCWIPVNDKFYLYEGVNYISSNYCKFISTFTEVFSCFSDYSDQLWQFDLSTFRWTWVRGSNSGGFISPSYALWRVEAPTNTPGTVRGALSWTSKTEPESLFFYGGRIYTSSSVWYVNRDVLAFNTSSLMWEAVDPITELQKYDEGIYFGNASLSGRSFAVTWTSEAGTLQVYGGEVFINTSLSIYNSDVWEYDVDLGFWRVFSFPAFSNYGTKGVYSATNAPGTVLLGYKSSSSYKNYLYIFGGAELITAVSGRASNSLWQLRTCSEKPSFHVDVNQTVDCFGCTYGQFHDEISRTCQNCAPGKFNAEFQEICQNCEIGKVSSDFGSSACSTCSGGTIAPSSGLSSCEACPLGKYSYNSSFCEICSPGTVANESAMHECVDCEAGKFSLNSSFCEVCPVGTYSNSSQDKCTSCPLGSISLGPGSTFCSYCDSWRYSFSSLNCELCPLGRFLNTTEGSCQSCAPGKFTNESGLSFCADCDPGKFGLNSSYCELCPVGSFSNTSSQSTCSSCLPGRIAPQSGLAICSPCLAGSYSVNASFCEICPSGKYSDFAWYECALCPSGRISNGIGASSCQQCETGQYITDESTCDYCPIGRFSDNDVCFDCPKGRIANSTGFSSCSFCSFGYYSVNATLCLPCEPGYFTNSSESSCFQCPSGFIAPEYASPNCTICSAGTVYINSTYCQKCEPGRSSSVEGSQEQCSQCSSGKFSEGWGNSICSSCAAGRFSSIGASSCNECSIGKFSSTGAVICTDCEVGRFASSSGSSFCNECPKSQFADIPGLGSCNSCPNNAITLFEGSKSVSYCICQGGFWGRAFLNETCTSCNANEGSSCQLNSTVPFVASGYYRELLNPDEVFKCIPSHACKQTGYEQTKCEAGYTGFLCSECVKLKYYRKDLNCVECPSPVLTVFLVIALIIAFGFVSYKVMISQTRIPLEARIGVSFLQIISLYPSLSNKWPSAMLSVFRVTSFTNFNLDLFSPECSVSVSFWGKLLVKLLIPVFIAVWIAIALFVTSRLRIRAVQNFKFSKNQVLSFAIFLLSVFFTILASTCLSIFNCSKVDNYKFVSNYDPSTECFDSTWWKYFSVVFLLSLIYLIGFPAFIIYNFWIYRANPSNEYFLSLFANITSIYKREYYYWELFGILKKLTFVVSSDFLSYNRPQSTRAFITIFFLFIYFAVESWTRPYSMELHNQFNLAWNIVAILILLSSFVFQSEDVTESDKTVFTALMIMVLVIMLLWTMHKVFTVKLPRDRFRRMMSPPGEPVKSVELASPSGELASPSGSFGAIDPQKTYAVQVLPDDDDDQMATSAPIQATSVMAIASAVEVSPLEIPEKPIPDNPKIA